MENMVFNLRKRIITNINRPYFRIFHLSLSRNPFLSYFLFCFSVDVMSVSHEMAFAWLLMAELLCGVVRNITKQTRWPMSSSNLLREEMTCDLVLIPLRSLSLFPVFVFLFLSRGEGFFFSRFRWGWQRFVHLDKSACVLLHYCEYPPRVPLLSKVQ